MENKFDSKERIARSNVYTIFGKYMKHQIKNNNDAGEILLKKAGLSKFVEEYEIKLCPILYNGSYENQNTRFNPEYVCISICEEIEDDEENLLRFLNTILENIREIKIEDYEKLSNFLNVLGYELMVDDVNGFYEYKLIPSSNGMQERNKDISYFYSMLSEYHSDLVDFYDEAVSDFGNGNYMSCIDSCRTLFEKFFKKLDTTERNKENYVKGILAATKENVKDGPKLETIHKIYKNWLDTKEGYNRFRLFQTLYSAMSGLGSHGEDKATKEDALLLLRYVEDCLLWCFRKGINC